MINNFFRKCFQHKGATVFAVYDSSSWEFPGHFSKRRKVLNWLTAPLVYTLPSEKKGKKSFDYIKNGLFQRHSPYFTQEQPYIRFSPNKINVIFRSPSHVHTPDACQADENGGPWQWEHEDASNQMEVDMLLMTKSLPEQP